MESPLEAFKTYTCSYRYQGADWVLHIKARISAMPKHDYPLSISVKSMVS